MYYIRIKNLTKENNIWTEEFDSLYLYQQRLRKLHYSKKLLVLGCYKI